MNKPKLFIKRLVFYWLSSFLLSISLYYILWLIMPNHYVFGALYRMLCYHYEHPIQYIAIPCFFYGIIAAFFSDIFLKKGILGKIFLTLIIIVLTILLSLPFGGILWHFHDMQSGYFPSNWLSIIIIEGISWGFEMGWLIVALSIPYNLIGSIICYFLTKFGAKL